MSHSSYMKEQAFQYGVAAWEIVTRKGGKQAFLPQWLASSYSQKKSDFKFHLF